MTLNHLSKLIAYNAPKWLRDVIKNDRLIPKYRVNFEINEQTNIENLSPLINQQFNINKKYLIYVKREDLNHYSSFLSGNKIRKLEFLFADAILNDCKHVITAGGLQSNHCRTVACAANMLNFKTHLFLRSHTDRIDEVMTNGNLLIDRLFGASIYLIEKRAQYLNDIKYKMDILQEKLYNYSKEKSYQITIGGSDRIGVYGYIDLFHKMIDKQNINGFIDDIVVTTGSGGSMSGLAIANLLTGLKFRIHALNVCDTAEFFHKHLDDTLVELGLGEYKSHDLVNIIDGYKGKGYGLSTTDELESIISIARSTNVLFDPVYTGKAFLGLLKTLKNDDNLCKKFKGNRILFIHTGGFFSHFDGRLDNIFNSSYLSKNSASFKAPIYDCFYDNINNINF